MKHLFILICILLFAQNADAVTYYTYNHGGNSTTMGSDGSVYNTYNHGRNSTTTCNDGTIYNTHRYGNYSYTYGTDGTQIYEYGGHNGYQSWQNYQDDEE